MAARKRARRAAPAAAGLDRLWAPWRMPYLRTAGKDTGCLFCRVARSRADRRDLVVTRTPHALLMLNRFPYSPAHVMVALTRHVGSFARLHAEEREELLALVALAERALGAEYKPHGLNVGANLGRVAGAGVPGHLHMHLVPRWEGDTNFMPAIAATRVLPESLDATWRRLRRVVATLAPAARRPSRASGARRG